MLLAHRPFTHKAKKTAGWNLFCRATLSLCDPVMQKSSYALPDAQAGSFFAFRPKLIC